MLIGSLLLTPYHWLMLIASLLFTPYHWLMLIGSLLFTPYHWLMLIGSLLFQVSDQMKVIRSTWMDLICLGMCRKQSEEGSWDVTDPVSYWEIKVIVTFLAIRSAPSRFNQATSSFVNWYVRWCTVDIQEVLPDSPCLVDCDSSRRYSTCQGLSLIVDEGISKKGLVIN